MVQGSTVYSAIRPNQYDGWDDCRHIDRDFWRGVVGKAVAMPVSNLMTVVWEDGGKRGDDHCVVADVGLLKWHGTPQEVVKAVNAEHGSKAASQVRKYFQKLGVMK